jgi:hypothetical protein
MKTSNVFRKAAKIIEDGDEDFCCHAIAVAQRKSVIANNTPAYYDFKDLYYKDSGTKGEREAWWRREFPFEAEAGNSRIIALCFAAAIAEDAECNE